MSGRRRFLAAGIGAACAAPFAALGRGAGGTLTATDVHVKGYPTVAAVEWIGEQLERATGGRLRIRLYHSGQLGREQDSIDMARFGAIDITRVYGGAVNNAFPLTQALCLPYVFESVAHYRDVVDGEVGRQVLDGFAKRDLVGLALYDGGARCFYNTRRPLRRPADLHGLKIRVPLSDMFIRLLRDFGANPTPLPLGQVFSSLETRMIDGAENNMRSFHSSRHFEAAPYWSESAHAYAPDVLLASRASLDAMALADRDLLRDLAQASVSVMRTLWDASEAQARAAVLAHGVAANDVDLAAFRAAAAPVLDDYRHRDDIAPLYRAIRARA